MVQPSMTLLNRMARAAWPCGHQWADHLAHVYANHAWEVDGEPLDAAATYLASRSFYYLSMFDDTAMIGDIHAMHTILKEDRDDRS